ncbi:MAG: hypothetical protein ACFFD2_15760 [Promethearchaeota archaeon]
MFQSCVLFSNDDYLWISPFTRYAQLIGFIIRDFNKEVINYSKKNKDIINSNENSKENTSRK